MNAAPQKDLKAFPSFSDLFPPSLIKDLRQSFKSRFYVVLLCLGLVYIGLGAKMGLDLPLLSLSLVALIGFVLPMRAGMAVASDLKEAGSNFMMLSPLSPWQIVRGQFLSALLQSFVICLLVTPALHHALGAYAFERLSRDGQFLTADIYANMAFIQTYEFLAMAMLTFFAGSAVLIALMMLNALVPIICRMGLAFFAALFLLLLFGKNLFFSMELYEDMIQFTPILFIAAFLMLYLARRHYASPSEVSSGFLRVFCLVYLGVCCTMLYLNPFDFYRFIHVFLCLTLIMGATAVDELLPLNTTLASRRKRCWLVRTCSSMSLTMFLLYLAIATVTTYFAYLKVLPQFPTAVLETLPVIETLPILAAENNLPTLAASFVLIFGVGGLYCFYPPLFITNLVSSRDNRNRFVVFACSMLAICLIYSLLDIQWTVSDDFLPLELCSDELQNLKHFGHLLDSIADNKINSSRFYPSYIHLQINSFPPLSLVVAISALLSLLIQRKR